MHNNENGTENLRTKIRETLSRVFKFEEFRGEQELIILHALAGGSSLVLMPTGMGKSLCYQIPALHLGGGSRLVLVVSPLVALMEDQVMQARARGIAATTLNSSLSSQEREDRQRRLSEGEFQLLYVTPERFRKPEFLAMMSRRQVSLLAVDEAHCISQWGHDFRPDYSRLGEIREKLGNPSVMALTATATPEVQQNILHELKMTDAKVFQAGIERANLAVNAHHVYGIDEKIQSLVGLKFQQQEGAGIIYFSLISSLQKASYELKRLNIPHLVYHGDLGSSQRQASQKKFIEEKNPLILATPAFGLGVDKSNVRWIVHMEIPGSLEAYYQEIGRAGRDGRTAQAHLLYDRDDVSIQMDFLKWANPEPTFLEQVYRLIEKNKLRAEQEGADFLRQELNFYNSRDFRVETALNQLERMGSLERVETKFGFVTKQAPVLGREDDELYKKRMEKVRSKLLQMVQWAEMGLDEESASADHQCRMQTIYKYFGHESQPCGKCDLCLKSLA